MVPGNQSSHTSGQGARGDTQLFSGRGLDKRDINAVHLPSEPWFLQRPSVSIDIEVMLVFVLMQL